MPGQRLLFRWNGGKFGTEMSGTFVAGAGNEIMLRSTVRLAIAEANREAVDVAVGERAGGRTRAQARLLVGLLAIFASLCGWIFFPEQPMGLEWVSAAEREALLTQAAESYASDNERFTLDAGAHLIAHDEEGNETLRTTVRVGRRAGAPVLLTEAGVLVEITGEGALRVGDTPYRRRP